MTTNLLSLPVWARRFDPSPSPKTLTIWARKGKIVPTPQKIGRAYYAHPEAQHIDELMQTRLVDKI